MIPVLLDLRIITIYTFGVFLVLAFFWGSYLLWKLGRLTAYKEEDIFDALFVSMFGGLVGGRLIYILFHFSDFQFDIVKYLLINGYPGMSLVGAIVGGFLVLSLFVFVHKMKWTNLIDYTIAPLFLAVAIGKVGAFLSGAEAGTTTKFIIAVKYANLDGLRHLTPLYEAVFFFVGCFIAYRLLFQIRREKLAKGFNFLFFIWFFSLTYALFDFMKSDRMMIGTISAYQILSLIALLTISIYFIYYWRNFLIHLFHGNKTSSHRSVHQAPERAS